MKVVIKRVNQSPQIEIVQNSLESLQSLVGGYIEVVKLSINDTYLICNEDGISLDLPINSLNIRGDFVICNVLDDEFESLTDNDIKKIMSYFQSMG